MKIPKLRFRGFSDEWEVKKIGDIADVKGGKRIPKGYTLQTENTGLPYITVSDMENGSVTLKKIRYVPMAVKSIIKNYKISVDDIYISVAGTLGLVGTIPKELDGANLTENANKLTNIKCIRTYLLQFLKSDRFAKLVKNVQTDNAQPKLAIYAIKSFTVSLPNKDEQEKVAGFLGVVDEKILGLEVKKAAMEKYKKGLMQKIFSQKIRFKDETAKNYADWDEKSLEEIADRITTRNKGTKNKIVLTNSAAQGIVNQSDFFNKDIANQNNLTNYLVVCSDDFVYNPRISKEAPVGPIKRNHLSEGVMSPLYSVFRFKIGNLDFFENYFETIYWHEYLKSVANSGARHDRMNITNADLYDLPLPFPCIEEQQKIADFLTSIDNKLNLIQKELEQAKVFKKALLQQMFV